MSEPAAELPISNAREHLADVVNRAVYAGEATYLTRRGRRLVVVVSAEQLAADKARAEQQAVVAGCRDIWQRAATANVDEATRAAIRELIDQAIEEAEDEADVTVIEAMSDEDTAVPWETVKTDLGL